MTGLSKQDALRMGIGKMPRGEVALVIASIGLTSKLISPLEFNSTILLVIFSAAITPIFLKMSYKEKEPSLATSSTA